MADLQHSRSTRRARLVIRGAVQGVGFRPFVYRLATELGLTGWVNNTAQGVFIEVEGPADAVDRFVARVEADRPPRAAIHSLETAFLDATGYTAFEIVHSEESGDKTAVILPDLATCPDCLRDIADPSDRRYRYPFTNCTNCGPRYSIIESLPYDRPNTSMKAFAMCRACRAEYEDPLDRRFHAQPTACPECGPQLALSAPNGDALEVRDCALTAAVSAIRDGRIVAVKGLGGFHLVVDARNDAAVRELRRRKHREEKPFALMAPDLATAQGLCQMDERETRALTSVERPIVLLTRRADGGGVAESVVPAAGAGAYRNPSLGVMLPYTPLHHLLMAELGIPVVATSGNLSDEPICIDERDALARLAGIADLFLVHDRPIVRHVDDSVVRVVAGREMVLRRARGYAPLPVYLPLPAGPPTLGVGAHQKNAVTLCVAGRAFVSQHVGDLETAQAFGAFERVADDLTRLYDVSPERVACDMHPDYLSTRYANRRAARPVRVQHHYAHVLACMAENEVAAPALGVSWDGTGYGPDGTIWGGEFLTVTNESFERTAHLRGFRLPGGERAVREPCRSALGLLWEAGGAGLVGRADVQAMREFADAEKRLLMAALEKQVNAPFTTSAGRLFDAAAALIGLRQHARFEGQAAMELEFAAVAAGSGEPYPFVLCEGADGLVVDWEPALLQILADAAGGRSIPEMARAFHDMLVEAIAAVARRVGLERVVLSGGCFQNRYLSERAVERLTAAGFRPYWHQRVPPNDGGISLGQVVAALRGPSPDGRATATSD